MQIVCIGVMCTMPADLRHSVRYSVDALHVRGRGSLVRCETEGKKGASRQVPRRESATRSGASAWRSPILTREIYDESEGKDAR
ncbi:hypothetical protein X777_10913 [Ooceraea biroi]|uniref:Uncharacterized protein n=1 Tax=Ooceraea biroi TaxID=2015173 RepID=A0A026W3B2_OOCBI|nr:hypothetical protein X777_10913 [Ooceraea biroi]